MAITKEGGVIDGVGLSSLSIYEIQFEGSVIGYAIQHQAGQGWSLYRMNGESGDLEYITATHGPDVTEIASATLNERLISRADSVGNPVGLTTMKVNAA